MTTATYFLLLSLISTQHVDVEIWVGVPPLAVCVCHWLLLSVNSLLQSLCHEQTHHTHLCLCYLLSVNVSEVIEILHMLLWQCGTSALKDMQADVEAGTLYIADHTLGNMFFHYHEQCNERK